MTIMMMILAIMTTSPNVFSFLSYWFHDDNEYVCVSLGSADDDEDDKNLKRKKVWFWIPKYELYISHQLYVSYYIYVIASNQLFVFDFMTCHSFMSWHVISRCPLGCKVIQWHIVQDLDWLQQEQHCCGCHSTTARHRQGVCVWQRDVWCISSQCSGGNVVKHKLFLIG